jgi:hypothetical protein
MIGYPESVAIVGVSWSIGWTVFKCQARPHCNEHIAVNKLLKSWDEFSRLLIKNASDIASIKQSVWDITLFVSEFVSGAMEEKDVKEKAEILRDKVHERTYSMREKSIGVLCANERIK